MDNNIFPLPFELHLAFVCLALLILVVRFIMTKRTYQIFMTVAVALTMAIYIDWGKTWYDCIGIIELVLVAGSLVSVIMDKKKAKELKADENPEETEQKQEAAQ